MIPRELVIAVAILVIIGVTVFVTQRMRKREAEEFSPGLTTSVPFEVDKATYDAHHPSRTCPVLEASRSGLNARAEKIASNILDTGRLRGFGDTADMCYFLNDPKHQAQDILLKEGACSTENPLFQTPAIKRVFESVAPVKGETVPLKKCVIEFEPTAAYEQMWTDWGRYEHNQLMLPSVLDNKKLRASIRELDGQVSSLMRQKDTLAANFAECGNQRAQCQSDVERMEHELKDKVAHMNDCQLRYTKLKQEISQYKLESEQHTAGLRVGLSDCTSAVAAAEKKYDACAKTEGTIRRENQGLAQTLDTLTQMNAQCAEDTDVCTNTLGGVKRDLRTLEESYNRDNSLYMLCSKDLGACKAHHENHVKTVSEPCARELNKTRETIDVTLHELRLCRESLRSERADGNDLRNQLTAMQARLQELNPENVRLKSELEQCQKAVRDTQVALEECLARQKGQMDAMQSAQWSRLQGASGDMQSALQGTVGAFCKRPEIVPDALSTRDHDVITSDIDTCKTELANTINDRDSFRALYIAEKSMHDALKPRFQTVKQELEYWKNKFFTKAECKKQHDLCDCGPKGAKGPAPPALPDAPNAPAPSVP